METVLIEWGGLALRWLHIITGMAWIGSSFYFMHIDAHMRAVPDIAKGGETWEVHGGGFYQVRKYLVAPEKLPEELIWHKWQSYSTWMSGFLLLCWIYYFSADLYLIDPAVRDLTQVQAILIGIVALAAGWLLYDFLCNSKLGDNEVLLAAIGFAIVMAFAYGFQQVFSGRGALIHTGALMATIMSGNVFFNIIPNQRKVIADLIAGRTPNPEFGKQAKKRSTHNNYLTLPVVFLMLSNHYPLTYSSPYSWVIIGMVLVAGALIRVFYNFRHAGKGSPYWAWAVAILLMLAAAYISAASSPGGREHLGLGPMPEEKALAGRAEAPKEVAEIIQSRCSMCHAREPVWRGIGVAPKGVRLETPADVAANRELIRIQTVATRAMPPNNITSMTEAERKIVGQWLASARPVAAKQ